MNIFLLHQLLENAAARSPEKEAVIFRDRSISYYDLERKSNQLAQMLLKNGVKSGDRIGILLGKCFESIVSIMGILKTGGCYVPIDPSAPATRVIHILRHCSIVILITSNHLLEKLGDFDTSDSYPTTIILTDGTDRRRLPWVGPYKVVGWNDIEEEADTLPKKVNVPDVAPAYILHTSGSAGLPKGVVISHCNALTFINMAAEFFHVAKDDRLCNHASLSFDLSIFDIFVAMRCRATIVLVPENLSIFPVKLAEYIDQQKITIWNSVSSILSMLAIRGGLNKWTFSNLRLVIFSGEILPVKYLRILRTHMPNVDFYNIYGQTEANSSTFYKVGKIPEDDAWRIPIGYAFPNYEVFLLNEDGKIMDFQGGEGEIYVKGSAVALGYWRDPETTSEKFIPDPRTGSSTKNVYKTGDFARLDENCNLTFLGRKDHLIKSRGYRIEPGEIDVVLNSHPLVRRAAVVGVPDEIIGNRIVGCVETVDGIKSDPDGIITYCSHLLPKYMVPENIVFFDNLPQTPNGKVDRNILVNTLLDNWKMQPPRYPTS
jgi:amino acid adenylation domain-containing protein